MYSTPDDEHTPGNSFPHRGLYYITLYPIFIIESAKLQRGMLEHMPPEKETIFSRIRTSLQQFDRPSLQWFLFGYQAFHARLR